MLISTTAVSLTEYKSHDPGVLVVLECIFSFDLSVPLNYLFEGFEKKILFIQVIFNTSNMKPACVFVALFY